MNTPPGGTYVAVGQSLNALVQYAYRVRSYQVLGGPGWASTDLWEIQARAPEGSVQPRPNPDTADFDAMERMLSQPDTIAVMLQSLLEDRFLLKVHRETREMGMYELAVAKDGLKMKLAADQTRPEQASLGVFPKRRSGSIQQARPAQCDKERSRYDNCAAESSGSYSPRRHWCIPKPALGAWVQGLHTDHW